MALVKRSKRYECVICSEDVLYEGSPTQCLSPLTTECNHDRQACDPCLTRLFEGAINGGRIQDLLCPDPKCKKPVPLETIRAVVSKKVLTL